MLNDEICKVRDKLNRAIENNEDYEKILKISVDLDKLIASFYKKDVIWFAIISNKKKEVFFTKILNHAIIKKMVHYPSHTSYYEGGAKNPLKGISMKFLVCAQNASFACVLGVRD